MKGDPPFIGSVGCNQSLAALPNRTADPRKVGQTESPCQGKRANREHPAIEKSDLKRRGGSPKLEGPEESGASR